VENAVLPLDESLYGARGIMSFEPDNRRVDVVPDLGPSKIFHPRGGFLLPYEKTTHTRHIEGCYQKTSAS